MDVLDDVLYDVLYHVPIHNPPKGKAQNIHTQSCLFWDRVFWFQSQHPNSDRSSRLPLFCWTGRMWKWISIWPTLIDMRCTRSNVRCTRSSCSYSASICCTLSASPRLNHDHKSSLLEMCVVCVCRCKQASIDSLRETCYSAFTDLVHSLCWECARHARIRVPLRYEEIWFP